MSYVCHHLSSFDVVLLYCIVWTKREECTRWTMASNGLDSVYGWNGIVGYVLSADVPGPGFALGVLNNTAVLRPGDPVPTRNVHVGALQDTNDSWRFGGWRLRDTPYSEVSICCLGSEHVRFLFRR